MSRKVNIDSLSPDQLATMVTLVGEKLTELRAEFQQRADNIVGRLGMVAVVEVKVGVPDEEPSTAKSS